MLAGLLVIGVIVSPAVATEAADEAAALPWYRVFLSDGQVIAVFGEITRVDDMVIVNVPTGPPDGGAPPTRALSLAASAVDWTRTDAYREVASRARFDQADGARVYAAFTDEVASTLRDVALLPDPLERIRRLESARARLAEWPAAHHGSRAGDVAATLSVVDDLLNGMRAAAGQRTFALALSATPAAVPAGAAALLPPPTLQDAVAQALGLASRVIEPAEKIALLESAASMLEIPDATGAAWAAGARRDVSDALRGEQRLTRAYVGLRQWALTRAARLMARADVRGLLRLRQDVDARDGRLRRQRPAEAAALLATLDVRLETTRRHRLLLERWQERQPALRRYADVVGRQISPGAPLWRALEDVKALAGPNASLLARAEAQVVGSRADAATLVVPDDARAVHGLWTSTTQMALRALRTRRAAVASGNLQQAWEASAAAAGALLLLQQVRADLLVLTTAPALPVAGL
ncbi:MAG: hypothetical protein H0V80_13775 [Acidobacteria bacterium]|nr:hypothetical protein [Acidobacteriota bacterium]